MTSVVKGSATNGTFAVMAGTGVTEEEDEGEGQSEDRSDEQVTAEVTDQEGRVYPERLDEEAADGVQAHVEQGDVAILEAVREAPGDEEEDKADEHVPEGLVEERRVEGGFVGEAGRTILGGYLYSPGEARGAAEEFLVEVVAPATDSLGEDKSGGRGVGED